MSTERISPIVAAARRRHELTRAKAIQALRELERTGAPVSFAAVAQTARISRSWLYLQDDLRAEIARLRDSAAGRPKAPAIPATQRASDASLRRRLELAEQRIRQLRADNDQLRRDLAQALGGQRHAGRGSSPATTERQTRP
jgi:hypothetical protein